MKRNRRQALVGVALMLPSLIGVTFMTLCPLAKTILRSFFSGLGWGRFAGFKATPHNSKRVDAPADFSSD